jgi:3-hydroxyisobutyrate dehydrogenase-like beta-hydroxyacid dehydrogenase
MEIAASEARDAADDTVGIVGLGIMGGSMGRHLLEAGYNVLGYDLAEPAMAAFMELGGIPKSSVSEVVAAADSIIISLPSVAAFEEAVAGTRGLLSAPRVRTKVVIEASTLPLAIKEWGRELLNERSITLLDCPVSGTGAQMAIKQAIFYVSGDHDAIEMASPVLQACSRSIFELGEFGNATKLKLVANLLVAIHNASAAEALVLAKKAGISLDVALPALVAGAGTSRILELRGSMMAEGDYSQVSMKVRTFQKDIEIISEFAHQVSCPLPLFAIAAQMHVAAFAAGHGDDDTASVHDVIEKLAGRI